MNENHFVKNIEDKDALVKEAAKMKKLKDISLKSGLFQVPEILEVNTDLKYLRMERINAAVELRKYLISNNTIFHTNIPALTKIYFKIGRILALIHKNLSLEPKEKMDFQSFERRDFCFLHGDLGLSNILIENGKIWIVDPSTSHYQKKIFVWGPFYYDLAQLIVYTKVIMPLAHYPFYRKKNVEILEKALINGYETERKIEVDEEKMFMMKKIILKNYLRAKREKYLKWARNIIVKNELKNY